MSDPSVHHLPDRHLPGHRFPGPLPARVDDDPAAADLARRVVTVPHVHETVVVLLGHDRAPIGGFRVNDVDSDDAVLDVARVIASGVAVGPGRIGTVVLVSVRPGRSSELADADRWLAIDDELAAAGCELLEWLVVGRDLSRPRDLVGAPARWTSRRS